MGIIQNMYLDDAYKGREAFSKVKDIVRKAGALLDLAVGEALSAVTPQDATGWFAHCGYQPLGQPL